MEHAQLMKGNLEGCVLGIIIKGVTYGYQILMDLEEFGFSDLGEGTLYPVLTRLDKKGYINCRKVKSPFGPLRKYYSITEDGEKWLEEFKESYKKVTESANAVLFGIEQKE